MKLATLALSLVVAVIALVAVESASAQGYGPSFRDSHISGYPAPWSTSETPSRGWCGTGGPRPSVPVWGPKIPYQIEVAPRPYQPWCGTGPRPTQPWIANQPRPFQPRCGNEPRPQVYGPFGPAPRPWQPINMPISADPFAP
jgi:hypothetical protein